MSNVFVGFNSCLSALAFLSLMVRVLDCLVRFQATEIGKSVNALRKHGSKEIRNLVRTLIE